MRSLSMRKRARYSPRLVTIQQQTRSASRLFRTFTFSAHSFHCYQQVAPEQKEHKERREETLRFIIGLSECGRLVMRAEIAQLIKRGNKKSIMNDMRGSRSGNRKR